MPRALVATGPVVNLRTAYLAAGGVVLVLAGIWRLVSEDGRGLIYTVCGLAALAFLPRRGLPMLAALVVIADGLLGLRWWESSAGLGGLAMASLVVPSSVGPAASAAAEATPWVERPTAPLTVVTVGRLELVDQLGDHAGWLLQRPVASFVWLYLLILRVAWPPGEATREGLGAQVYPKLDPDPRQETVRKRVIQYRSELPGELAATIHIKGHLYSLDLSRADVDVIRLLALRDRVARRTELLDGRLMDDVQATLAEVGWGLFLPVWEDVEQRQTQGGGKASEAIRQARLVADTARADLAVALGDSLLARQQTARALNVLDNAYGLCGDREDVATRLISALLATGSVQRATELRARFKLGEVN